MTKEEESYSPYQGYVKLYRNILDSPIIKNPNLLQIYIWCLLKANHKAQWVSINGKEVYCDVGQFITGRKVASDDLGMKEGTYYSNIKKLKDYGYLKIESNNQFSIVTVVNYGSVAPSILPTKQQKKNKKIKAATTNQQLNKTNNNDKNEKKENKKIINSSFSNSFINNNEGDKDYVGMALKVLNTDIREVYPRVASIPNQLSYDEFNSLYGKYDREDIYNEIEKLNNWKDVDKQNSLHKILLTFLENNKKVKPMPKEEKNYFEMEERWYADTEEVDLYIEEVKDKKVFMNSRHSGCQKDMRHFIRKYLFWTKAFEDERYPDLEKLRPLSLRQAIKFEKENLEFWGSEEDVEDLHYSPTLKDCKSAYSLLVAHSKYKWGED